MKSELDYLSPIIFAGLSQLSDIDSCCGMDVLFRDESSQAPIQRSGRKTRSSFVQRGPYDDVVREAKAMAENSAREMEARTARVTNPYTSKLGERALAHDNEVKASAEKLFGGNNMRKAPDE